MNKRVCHFTSAHPRYDTRLYIKECASLATAGYQVTLMVADSKGDESSNGFNIKDIGIESTRFKRILKSTWKMYRAIKKIDASVYHFHDSELLPVGLLLKLKGKKVIYDVHEDVPRDILSKHYLPKIVRPMISWLVEKIEKFAAKRFDYIITATPYICQRFKSYNQNCIDVNNFPLLSEIGATPESLDKDDSFCYLGAITKIRGIQQALTALQFTDATFKLVGEFESEELKKECQADINWSKVKYYGYLSRNESFRVLNSTRIGLVNILPDPNLSNALPNKIFEYMCAGIPVITSAFPQLVNMIEKHKCGIAIDPTSPQQIAEAINYLLNNRSEADQMGRNGQIAVRESYNWQSEDAKLLKLYQQVTG